MSSTMFICNTDNITLTTTANSTDLTVLQSYRIPIILLLLYGIAIIENAIAYIFLMKKNKTDGVFIVIACLAVTNALLAIDGCLVIFIFLYICINTPFSVPPMLCSIIYTFWLLATQISITLIMLISIIRVVSISSILRKSMPKRLFTRKRVVVLVIAVWLISVFVCIITVTVDYSIMLNPPTFCRFRTSLSVLRVTTWLYLGTYIVNTAVCVSLYAASICILVRVHLVRKVEPSVTSTSLYTKRSVRNESSNIIITDLSVQLPEEARQIEQSAEQQRKSETFVVEESLASTSSNHSYRKKSARNSRELTATLFVGLIIVLHSASIIPWIAYLYDLTNDTNSSSKSLLALLFGIVKMLVDPLIYITTLSDIRNKVVKCLVFKKRHR